MLYKYFFPDYSYKSIDEIDVSVLYERGIRFVLLDIDNTLVPYTSPSPDERAIKFLKTLQDNGIKFCFVSNNSKQRIDLFNETIGAPVYSRAKKPLLFGIKKAMKNFGAKKHNTALIGDQLFTDILGAKRAKILTVLVCPILECESLFFRFKRYFEKKILNYFSKNPRT